MVRVVGRISLESLIRLSDNKIRPMTSFREPTTCAPSKTGVMSDNNFVFKFQSLCLHVTQTTFH